MTANILDGHAHAQIVIDKVASELDRLPRAPGLAVVLVGCDAASQIYVQSKVRMADGLACAARSSACRTTPARPICLPGSWRSTGATTSTAS